MGAIVVRQPTSHAAFARYHPRRLPRLQASLIVILLLAQEPTLPLQNSSSFSRSSSLPFLIFWPIHPSPSPSSPRKTSLITTTRTTTSTRFYRRGHLLENNIHKVKPRRYERRFRSIFERALASSTLAPRRVTFLASRGEQSRVLVSSLLFSRSEFLIYLTRRLLDTRDRGGSERTDGPIAIAKRTR